MPRSASSVLRVVVAAGLLLGALSVALVLIGQPSTAGAGPLALPNPAPHTAVGYGEAPLKVLLVGDSMAGSLGAGLGAVASAYNVELANAGEPGCSLSMDGAIQLSFKNANPGAPCVLNHPEAILAVWQSWVDAFRPDVVLYLARSDLLDQVIHGRFTHVGRRDFNPWYAARLRQGIRVLASRGARVVLMTVPVSTEPVLHPRPQDNPLRVAENGALLRMAAAATPGGVASVYDLAQLLTPNFTYRSAADEVQLRCADGVHLTPDAGIIVAVDLLPRLWAIAAAHRVAGGGRWVDGPVPATTPSWYQKLPGCG